MENNSNVEKFDRWMKHTVASAYYHTPAMFEARKIVATHQVNSLKNKLKKK